MIDTNTLLEALKPIEALVRVILEEDGLEDTPQNRLTLFKEVAEEIKNEQPGDSLIQRNVTVLFDWYAENLQREIDGLDPIPVGA